MKMEIQNNSWSVKQLSRMIERETILFTYPIQRASGQWSLQQKSNLIHTLAMDYPVPPIYFLKYDEKYTTKSGKQAFRSIRQTLDGKQRLTTIVDYLNNKFYLSKETDNVVLETGEEYEIAGLYFDELDEEVQEAIESKMLSTYNIDDRTATDEQIEDLFFRMNDGTALTIIQKSKALMGREWSIRMNDLQNHSFFVDNCTFSKTQMRNEVQTTVILQTLMMLEDIQVNMTPVNLSKFAKELRMNKKAEGNYLLVKKAIDEINEKLGDVSYNFLKRINVPIVLTTIVNEGMKSDFKKWFETFIESVNKDKEKIIERDKHFEETNEWKEVELETAYNEYLGSSSASVKKVYGRLNEMTKHYLKTEMLEEVEEKNEDTLDLKGNTFNLHEVDKIKSIEEVELIEK